MPKLYRQQEQVETCSFLHVHEDRVAEVQALLPGGDTLTRLADLFKVFSDTTRIKILYSLMSGERRVADIAETVGATQSAVSHQLRILKNAKLIKSRREGKQIIYSLSDDHVKTIIDQGLEHIEE